MIAHSLALMQVYCTSEFLQPVMPLSWMAESNPETPSHAFMLTVGRVAARHGVCGKGTHFSSVPQQNIIAVAQFCLGSYYM